MIPLPVALKIQSTSKAGNVFHLVPVISAMGSFFVLSIGSNQDFLFRQCLFKFQIQEVGLLMEKADHLIKSSN